MGQQCNCTCKHAKRQSQGQALLETDSLIFRGDFRLAIPFKDMTAVSAEDGELRISSAQGNVVFTLGPAAQRWADKILHPPSRMDKLGVKSDFRIALIGQFDKTFQAEVSQRTDDLHFRKTQNCDLLFFAADIQADLQKLPSFVSFIKPAGAIWIAYPRGVKVITEAQVLAAGRAAKLKDIKVTRFSDTHTALKFVVPVKARAN